MKKINKIVSDFLLSELCLDNRVEDGIFDIFNNDHMDVLREKLVEMGIPKSEVVELANNVTEGKYPERQAYNANGILDIDTLNATKAIVKEFNVTISIDNSIPLAFIKFLMFSGFIRSISI